MAASVLMLLKGWSGRWHSYILIILPDFSLMPHKARWPIPRVAASPSQRLEVCPAVLPTSSYCTYLYIVFGRIGSTV